MPFKFIFNMSIKVIHIPISAHQPSFWSYLSLFRMNASTTQDQVLMTLM